MPSVGRSWYADMVNGPKYWTFISEELPAIARSFFPLSDRREDNFVAGLSMGGYGAFKLVLRFPDRFAAGASLSGALDIGERSKDRQEEFRYIFGDAPLKGSMNDLFYAAKECKTKASIFRDFINGVEHPIFYIRIICFSRLRTELGLICL